MTHQTIDFVVPVAFKDVFDAIAPSFERETGHRFETSVMLNPEVPGHIARGCRWSIAASNATHIQAIIDAGDTDATLYHLGYSPLSFGVRGTENTTPITSPEGIARFLRGASRIAVTGAGTSGYQFAQLLDKLEIGEDLASKVLALPGGGPMASLVQGTTEVAALPLTNIATIAGIRAAAICPYAFDVHIDLAFCLHQNANIASKAFAAWLMDADLQSYGLFRDAEGW